CRPGLPDRARHGARLGGGWPRSQGVSLRAARDGRTANFRNLHVARQSRMVGRHHPRHPRSLSGGLPPSICKGILRGPRFRGLKALVCFSLAPSGIIYVTRNKRQRRLVSKPKRGSLAWKCRLTEFLESLEFSES